ncbi:MAG: hypothetical protein PHG36_06130 [Dehalococcoidia bacterium]|nr:hypothetical protein [Dehalococcoidia bacterium]
MQQRYKCPNCNSAITYETSPCPYCKYPVNWLPAQQTCNHAQSHWRKAAIRIGRNPLLIGIVRSSLIIVIVVGSVFAANCTPQVINSSTVQPTEAATPTATPAETPAATQSQTPIVQPMPVLEVKWEEIKLPPLKYGYDGIECFIDENNGNTISVYRLVGPADGGKASKYSLWRTEDGAKTWKELEEVVIHSQEADQLGFFPSGGTCSAGPAGPLRNEEEVVKQQLNPLVIYSNPYPWMVSKSQNNVFACVCYFPFESPPHNTKMYWVYRLFLSTDSGGSWKQMNFPSLFAPYDAYPETPQLTLLSEAKKEIEPMSACRWLEVVPSEDGSIKLFLISSIFNDGFWQATIKSPD